MKIEILDAAGSVIRKYSSSKTEPLEEPLDPEDKKPEKQIKPEDGLNRFVWDLHYEEATASPAIFSWEYNDGAKGPLALPGNYQVRLTANGKSLTAPFELKIDPASHHFRERSGEAVQTRDGRARAVESRLPRGKPDTGRPRAVGRAQETPGAGRVHESIVRWCECAGCQADCGSRSAD